jgi:hypothetical protein
MNQITQGLMVRPLAQEENISVSFNIPGYGKMSSIFSEARKMYKNSFLHDFYKVWTSKVD